MSIDKFALLDIQDTQNKKYILRDYEIYIKYDVFFDFVLNKIDNLDKNHGGIFYLNGLTIKNLIEEFKKQENGLHYKLQNVVDNIILDREYLCSMTW